MAELIEDYVKIVKSKKYVPITSEQFAKALKRMMQLHSMTLEQVAAQVDKTPEYLKEMCEEFASILEA